MSFQGAEFQKFKEVASRLVFNLFQRALAPVVVKDDSLTCPYLQSYTHLLLESAVGWWLVCL